MVESGVRWRRETGERDKGMLGKDMKEVWIEGVDRELTMPVVVEVEELVIPLRDNSQGVLDESADDQEASDGGNVSV